MSTLSNRLRFGTALLNYEALIELCEEAANEIDRLEAKVKSLDQALDFSLQKSAQMAIDAFKLESKP